LTPDPLQALAECDLGRWEGLSWQDIREREPESYRQFMSDPARHGYPGGESFQDVYDRVVPLLERLLANHAGQSMLVVAHLIVFRVYLASLLALAPGQARQVKLDNGSISVVVRQGLHTSIRTLNDTTHLTTLVP
jgi:broad specificity phosphatase PhoE